MESQKIPEYNEAIADVLAAWVEYAIRALKENLRKKKLVFTEELEQSLKFDISEIVDGVGGAKLDLKNYGRFRDMKRLTFKGPANFEAIREWVESIGIQKFKFVPGYDPSKRTVRRVPVTSRAMNRIAWGVAWGRFRKFKHRRKQWLNKYFYGPVVARLVEALIEKTGTSAVQIVERDITNAFSGK